MNNSFDGNNSESRQRENITNRSFFATKEFANLANLYTVRYIRKSDTIFIILPLCNITMNSKSSLPIILVQVNLGFILVSRILFQNWGAFLGWFLAKSHLTFLFLSVTSDLHLMVNPLYLHSWRCLLIIRINNDIHTSSRVFLNRLGVKGFFFTMERVLWSSTLVIFCDLPGSLVLLSSPVQYLFFQEHTKLFI